LKGDSAGTPADAIRQRVRQFVRDNFLFGAELNGFSDSDSFLERGILDSTGVLELIGFVEKEFDVHFMDDELTPENLDSLDGIAAFILRRRSSNRK
jgi:acyl carrier protein